ncbi:hypothetical protein BST81_20260 [Leptolyngbya sp. 'hensonii']|uniref:C39 family peptidase n=1 Tax=Leptolyngbya sp. 'hensonii' TaxID=1922337 RepID=UPI0009500567|nr:C39 family peptidase [Leptolyngbya sp. 'hensonii']OLP16537.1 hypothetical protein BST81_20260 [Leptolyngbya sp. 'hensonii']
MTDSASSIPNSASTLLPLTYLGPREVLINQPIILKGNFDPAQIAQISLVAEDKFALTVVINTQTKTWQVNLPQGFKTGGQRWLRLKGTNRSGKVVSNQVIYLTVSTDPMTVGEALTLKVLQDTLFKVVPADSSTLQADQKVTVEAGKTFTVTKYGFVDGHLKLLLSPPIAPIGEFGFFYEPHVQLSKGPKVLRFDIEDVADIPLIGQVLVTQTTLLKTQPIDSSQLPDSQKTPLIQGLVLQIIGFASISGHFRLILQEEIPGFGKTGYVYWQHVQIKKDGRIVGFTPNAINLTILQTTLLKKRPVQSNTLSDREKVMLPKGGIYGVVGYSVTGDHIKLALNENLPDFGNTGYLYINHIRMKRGSQIFNPAPKSVELNVPYFSQRDNPRLSWATCNVTAIGMVMYFYGVRSQQGGQLEDELLQWCFDRYGQGSQTDNMVLSQLIKAYGFNTSFSTTRRWSQVRDELVNGRPVVLGGLFTHGGHIVTLVGYTPLGYLVNDPWGDALSGYTNMEGRKLLYPYSYVDQKAGPDGGVWAHFISRPQ